jgi:hypothetical protein
LQNIDLNLDLVLNNCNIGMMELQKKKPLGFDKKGLCLPVSPGQGRGSRYI